MAELPSQKILIVDDDPLDRELYKRYLLDTPGRSFVFGEESTGLNGLARIAVFRPDCILLDFNLPDMNGREFLDALRGAAPSLPAAVVVLTAVRDERVAVDAMKSGALDYLLKGELATGTIAHAIDNAIAKFRMQREIEEQRQRYRSLIEAIPQIVWTATPEGRVDFVNSRWFEYLGTDLETFNRAGWAMLLHPDDAERSLEWWNRGLQAGAAFQIEHRLKMASNGSFRWHLSRTVPICDDHGQVIKWLGASTDVEDQKRSQMAVFTKQKLESLGLLAGGIAHDFNNLLSGILGGASLIAEALPTSDPHQPILNHIIHSSERAAHLTRQMLAYAGKGRFLVQQVDINELVRITCDLAKASIPKNVVVSIETRENLPRVEADSGQMQQIIMNLIINAAEAVDETKLGSVLITTDLVEIDSAAEKLEFVAGSVATGPHVVLQVQDNGCGMDKATSGRIFDPFFTTKFTGRGLGLSAVEGILRSQNAGMALQTALGVGSSFRVYLPASRKPADLTGRNSPAALRRGEGTVLVVDDEETVRRTAKLSLENGGFSVRLAHDGEEAIRILQSQSERSISLVVLDLSMPVMSGKQVMQQIRVLGIDVPVLICSGYSEVEVFQRFSGLDIAGFIQKPFTARQLANRVSSILFPEPLLPA